MDRLSTLLEFDRKINELRVDGETHAKYLDKEKRAKMICDFAQEIAYADLTESERRRYHSKIDQSLRNLELEPNSENEPGKTAYSPSMLTTALISGGFGFIAGWKANDVYRGIKEKDREKTIEEIMRSIEKGLKSKGDQENE